MRKSETSDLRSARDTRAGDAATQGISAHLANWRILLVGIRIVGASFATGDEVNESREISLWLHRVPHKKDGVRFGILCSVASLILRLSDKLLNEAVSLPEFNDVMAFDRLLRFLDGLRIFGTGENSHAGNLSAGSDRINTILPRSLAAGLLGGDVQLVLNSAEFASICDFIGARRQRVVAFVIHVARPMPQLLRDERIAGPGRGSVRSRT
jgi:hypothetical protein